MKLNTYGPSTPVPIPEGRDDAVPVHAAHALRLMEPAVRNDDEWADCIPDDGQRYAKIAERMPARRVYDRARGPLPRLAEPFAQRGRTRRLEWFLRAAGVGPQTRIVDIGCGEGGLIGLAPQLSVTGVDVQERPGYPGSFVCADATKRLPFADGEFDLAYANSVIEHIPPAKRDAFARELRRVARGWYVQTPAISFPIEPHSLLPAAHWLPRSARRRYWHLGAGGDPDEVHLLGRRELEALFGPAIRERFGPLTKSWISLLPPPSVATPPI
ncbi:MAG: class I SAM-dependent methyltransferase [Actinomycetota bacterium]|nr:class I SAM-dependent methyltransferase [Actinomycetota bacterium]